MAPRCRPPGPCFRAAPHGGRGCQRGPGRSRGAHPPCPRPLLREAPGRRPCVGFWQGASVHPGLHSRCAWEARCRGTRPAGSRLCAWWARVVGSGSSMWAVHSGRAGTFVPGPSPGRAIGAIGGPCRASGQVGTEASPPGLTLRSLWAPQAPPQAPRNTFVFLLGRERKRQTLPGGWAFGWLDI